MSKGGFVAQSSAGRKALATMGRKGGQKSAQRWKTEPDSEYAQGRRETLAAANERRKVNATADQFAIASWFLKANAETGEWPTVAEAMDEFRCSRSTVKRALQNAGIVLPRGRKKGQK